ncbi:MAG: DUF421 domain-containing protein [Firmicutes bacterium]|jgi:uncharacterized membrane protein YcaP (DUF421 family)|nr:DUF421 domain-containing protein [Bacillota bacterium]
MIIVFIRTLILFTLVIVVIRVMGKRQVGEFQPYELAILIMISALAAIPMEDIAIPLSNTIIPILLLFSIQIILSLIALKNEKIRALLDGRPSIVIENGRIVEAELKKLRVNINDMLELIRLSGYPSLNDIEFAILETNGKLSVLPKSQHRPVTPEDLNIETQYEGLPYPLVADGNINYEMLTKVKLNETWLKEELSKLGYLNINDVFLASLGTNGELVVQRKE